MKTTFTFFTLIIPIFLFCQSKPNWNFSSGTSIFGIYSQERQFKNPSGESVHTAGGFGYKIGGRALFPKGNFALISGLNFKQTYQFFEVSEFMAIRNTDGRSFSSTGVSVLDRVRQSYLELPLGIGIKFYPDVFISAGAIFQLQLESCRHRSVPITPQNATLLEPLATDLDAGVIGFFFKFEKEFQLKSRLCSWDVFLQTNHDKIELPNTATESDIQYYLGGGFNYFFNSKS